jgi:hypothetical protein
MFARSVHNDRCIKWDVIPLGKFGFPTLFTTTFDEKI